MLKNVLAATLVIFAMAACTQAEASKPALGEWTEVQYGKEVSFDNGPSIKFVELETDSRCATGVTCIWAGEAKAQISLNDSGNATTHVLIDGASDDKTEEIRGYKVDYSINPYPKAGEATPKEDYILKIRVDKDTPVSSDMTPKPGTPEPTVTYPTSRVKASIDALDILTLESFPPQYMVKITSGLPSGCARFDGYDVRRDGDVITITVWNTVPADDQVACTAIYGMKDTSVNLGSDFEAGKAYTAVVNDEKKTFVAQRTTTPVPGTPQPTATTYPTSRVKAPIDKAEIAVMKSLPPQYSVEITSGLPSGCARFDGYDVKREGELITINVWNTMPKEGTEIACTMIYGIVESSVKLGSDFETGRTYTVLINDEKRTFVAQ